MSKLSGLEKAIAALEADRAVLDLAIAKLKAQQIKAPVVRRPRAVAAAEKSA